MIPSASAIFDYLSDWAIPPSLRRDPDIFRQAKRVALFDMTIIFWSVVFAGIHTALGAPRCGLLTLLNAVGISTSLLALKRGKSPVLCGNILCLSGCCALFGISLLTGGSKAPALLWFSCAPVIAVTASGALWGSAWLLITLCVIAFFAVAEAWGVVFPNEFAPAYFKILEWVALMGLVSCHFILAWVRVGVEQRAMDALNHTNRRLAKARKDLETLERGFGFSMEEWAQLKREKAALERALGYKTDRSKRGEGIGIALDAQDPTEPEPALDQPAPAII